MTRTRKLLRPALVALVPVLLGVVAGSARAEVYGVRLTHTGDPATSVAISWSSDDPTDNRVVYGTSPEALAGAAVAGESVTLANPLGTSFSAELRGLTPATTYFYRVGNPGGALHPTGEPFSFRTLPADPCEPFRFVVIGDNRSDFNGIGPSALWPGILAEAVAELPDLFLNTGDMVKNGEDPVEWRNFLLDSEVGLARVPSLLTMGNHDEDDVTGEQALYNRLFALPRNPLTDLEDYYSLDAGPVHFVSLSTQFVRPGSQELADMLAWLEADLAATEQPWIVVFFHKAVYSKGNHSTGEEHDGIINASFVPLFDAHDVDLVFNGHSHNYERYVPTTGVDQAFGGRGRDFPAGERDAFVGRTTPLPDGAVGTTYVVTGGAGALTTTVGGFTCVDVACTYCTGFNLNCDNDVFVTDQDGYVVYAGEHNFVVVDVAAERLSVRAWATVTGNASGGFELDRFEMTSSDFDPALCAQVGPDDGGPGDVGPDVQPPEGGEDAGDAGAEPAEEPEAEPAETDAPTPGRDVERSETGSAGDGAGGASSDDSCGCAATASGRGAAAGPGLLLLGALACLRRPCRGRLRRVRPRRQRTT
jgi:acid phosphatase type 7